jgi:hypothetical protein
MLGKAIEVYKNTAVIPSSSRLHFLIDQLQNIGVAIGPTGSGCCETRV